jgi:hypothetical protein
VNFFKIVFSYFEDSFINSGIMCAELATAYEDEKALGIANEEDEVFFERLYPRLETWFQWFNTSQTGMLFYSQL